MLWPREHGAWGMLLFPFVSALLVSHSWSWNFIPATVTILAGFLIREPLAVLAYQRYVWTQQRPETETARRSLLFLLLVLLASTTWLGLVLPLPWLLLLALAGVALTGGYIAAAVHHRRRSVWIQLAGTAGLCGSSIVAFLSAGRSLDWTLFLLWLTHMVHNTGSVLTVHALIDARKARKYLNRKPVAAGNAARWQVVQLGVAAASAAMGGLGLGAALLLPWTVHTADLARLERSPYLKGPLRKLGFRELGLSFLFSVAVLAALW